MSDDSSVGLLPSGRKFEVRRNRSAGPLDAEELAYCRAHSIPLAFDPIQHGAVTLDCVDDMTPAIASVAELESDEPSANAAGIER